MCAPASAVAWLLVPKSGAKDLAICGGLRGELLFRVFFLSSRRLPGALLVVTPFGVFLFGSSMFVSLLLLHYVTSLRDLLFFSL